MHYRPKVTNEVFIGKCDLFAHLFSETCLLLVFMFDYIWYLLFAHKHWKYLLNILLQLWIPLEKPPLILNPQNAFCPDAGGSTAVSCSPSDHQALPEKQPSLKVPLLLSPHLACSSPRQQSGGHEPAPPPRKSICCQSPTPITIQAGDCVTVSSPLSEQPYQAHIFNPRYY